MLKIDKELEKLIPPQTDDEQRLLKESILSEGCRDAIVIWNDVIVDGHHRYKICTENKIPFNTKRIEFQNREEAKEWIIDNQLGRRNIQDYQRGELVLKLKEVLQARAKENQRTSTGGTNPQLRRNSDKAEKPMRTDEEMAKKAGIGKDNMRKIEFIANNGSEVQKERARKGGKGNSINAISKEVAFEQNKDKTKICKKCGEEKPYSEFEVGRHICEACRDNQKYSKEETPIEKTTTEEQPKEEEIDTGYDHDLYNPLTVGKYTIDAVLIEIEGARESLIDALDINLGERKDVVYENADKFNAKIDQIINELKGRKIDETNKKNT